MCGEEEKKPWTENHEYHFPIPKACDRDELDDTSKGEIVSIRLNWVNPIKRKCL